VIALHEHLHISKIGAVPFHKNAAFDRKEQQGAGRLFLWIVGY
jgi:hypothetical protein